MLKHTLASAAVALAAGSAQAITIEFDYSYDTGAFFTSAHKSVMSTVATEFGSRLTDSLAAITVGGVNQFQPEVGLITGASSTLAPSQSIPADTLRIFVGARSLDGNTLGIGGTGYAASGTTSFRQGLANRGQAAPQGSDYGPFGGAMVFDSGASWYVDDDVSTVE
ncbi:MAG: peptidase M10A and M12B matrixin and adamalysin, partial [Proteobacteria bacterium]